MRKLVLLALVLVGLAAPAVAQDEASVADVFLGYSLVRSDSENFHGANGSVAVNLNNWFSIVGDVSGHAAPLDTDLFVYTFGPQLTYGRGAKITPFTRALFGGIHARSTGFLGGPTVTANGFAMNLGGGFDWNPTHSIGVRLIQADALVTRFSGNTSTDARLSFGVVFRIGSR